MNEELQNTEGEKNKDYFLGVSVLISAIIIAGAWIYTTGLKNSNVQQASVVSSSLKTREGSLEEQVLPSEGVVLPVRWDNLGLQMMDAGVIDQKKFYALYAARGGLSKEEKRLLEDTDNGNLKITSENSGFLLNLFWALGLGTKNDILEKGPMMDARYGGAGKFASTGGWPLAVGSSMDHYSRHSFITLTPQQQVLVERVAKNIYRPCCGNSTYFPDCNHGMAMLGLLELMASQGVSEEEMYRIALQVNSFWFPDTYLAIAQYFKDRGVSWEKVNPKEVLGAAYSSVSGYQRILKEIDPQPRRGGSGCGAEPAPVKSSGGSGCGA